MKSGLLMTLFFQRPVYALVNQILTESVIQSPIHSVYKTVIGCEGQSLDMIFKEKVR